MRIHQASCNKDYTCSLGDCPSFVTLKLSAGSKEKGAPKSVFRAPSERPAPAFDSVYRILSPGIGGTGVITINALLATAAAMDGLSVATLDQTGLAQKGGAVVSHLILTHEPVEVAARINTGNADLILGFDLLGAISAENLKCADPERTAAVINADVTPTSEAVRQDRRCDSHPLLDAIQNATMRGRCIMVDASRIAEELFGSHLFVNMFLAGVAWQGGYIPIQARSIEAAIRLNGVDVDRNLQAFSAGRAYYEFPAPARVPQEPNSLDYYQELVAYQSEAWAREWRSAVDRVNMDRPDLADAVAANLFKLMAYKDEYEVARLLTDPAFEARTRNMWDDVESISYNLHPPLLRSLGLKKKMRFGPWFRTPLRLLARCKGLRGTPFDLFGYSRHRREERALIVWYRDLIDAVLAGKASPEVLALPDKIRGFEGIKAASIEEARRAIVRDKLEANV